MDSGQWFMRRRFSKLFTIYMYINLYKTKFLLGGPYKTPENFICIHRVVKAGLTAFTLGITFSAFFPYYLSLI